MRILENTKEALITDEIEAFDPDTTADLIFSIDWSKSRAEKPGKVVDRKFFEGWENFQKIHKLLRLFFLLFRCFIIEKLEGTDNNKVFGVLSVNTSFDYNIDFEEFETVYLTIVVEDVDQEIMPNHALATLVVQIIDENDNAPEFVGDTLEKSRIVVESAPVSTLIDNILARDIDGPEFSVIHYSFM